MPSKTRGEQPLIMPPSSRRAMTRFTPLQPKLERELKSARTGLTPLLDIGQHCVQMGLELVFNQLHAKDSDST